MVSTDPYKLLHGHVGELLVTSKWQLKMAILTYSVVAWWATSEYDLVRGYERALSKAVAGTWKQSSVLSPYTTFDFVEALNLALDSRRQDIVKVLCTSKVVNKENCGKSLPGGCRKRQVDAIKANYGDARELMFTVISRGDLHIPVVKFLNGEGGAGAFWNIQLDTI